MGWQQLFVVSLIVLSSVGSTVTAANESPLADAGLDQQVERGSTVLLDATGSRDPDGELVGYSWRIEAPNGSTVQPDCSSCSRTRFRATTTGRYAVTVTVTDDDGATSRDTLYVTVESEGEGPSVDLSGPTEPTVDEQATYTARFSPGDAPISGITWFEEGTRVAEREPSGRRDRLTRSFDSATLRTLEVRVTDEAGRTARATLEVDPRVVPDPPDVTPDGPPAPASPTVEGPQLLTGEPPFRGSYSLDAAGGSVEDVSWVTTGDADPGDRSAAVDWSPGRQDIYAEVSYETGLTRRATFSDGGTTVIVDPAPDLQLSGGLTDGTVSGDATATDAFGNLQRLVLRSNGTVLSDASGDGDRLVREFDIPRDRVGDTLTAVAVDERGQRAVETLRLGAGQPELVSARFVNDPVDSYHPRIAESRYSGEHVVRVDLNGVDPSSVDIDVGMRRPEKGLSISSPSSGRAYLQNSDTLVYRTFWASESAEDIRVGTTVRSEYGWMTESRDTLDVEPSPPEVRVSVQDPGRTSKDGELNSDDKKDWGIVVDASRSFDPDGTELEFDWIYGATASSHSTEVGHFNARRRGALEIIDDQDQISVWRYEFHGSYNPGIKRVEQLSEGPYEPNETVRLKAITPLFETTKDRYDVNLDATLDGKGTITDEERVAYQQTTEKYDSDYFGYDRYEWTMDVPAKALMSSTPTPQLTTRNPKRPVETVKHRSLPTVEVEGIVGNIQNLSVENLRYLVERQEYEEVTAQTEDAVEFYQDEGYEVASTDGSGIVYDVEERVKVQDAAYETRSRSFSSPQSRRLFMEENPEWQSAGTRNEVVTETFTETEWRNDRGGRGDFTGDTRRVKVQSARYQTEYRYVSTSTTTETVTRERQRCIFSYCWTVEVEDTVIRTERDYYWSASGGGYGARPTGESRRRLVEPAEYETQYRYEVTEERRRSITQYLVERNVKVAPATYEWRHFETTHDRAYAKSLTDLSDSYRIGQTESTKEWTLRRKSGSKRTWVSSLEEGDSVLKTSGTIRGERPIRSDGEVVDTESFEKTFTAEGELSPEQLKDRFVSSRERRITRPEAPA